MTVLTDIAIRRQVLLERLKAGEVRKFTATLQKLDSYIRQQLSAGRLTDFRRARLEAQLAGMQQVLRGHYLEYAQTLTGDLKTLAVEASTAEAATFRAMAPAGVSIATPAPNQVWAAVTVDPLTMNGASGAPLLSSFMEQWADSDATMVTNVIRQGYLLGETNEQIIARVRGTAALRHSDGVLAQSRHHAETVTRTAIQHVANSARAQTWAANSDIIDEYQWVSTLDSRTTPLCRDRDMQKFPVGQGPLPPAHPNCRSTTVAVIKGEFGRLLEEEGERASADGGTRAGESYYDWLGRQPAEFQDQALGPTRGKLFRDGGLSAEDFSRLQLGKNFEPLTLDQMRELEPEAFRRAGLAPPPNPDPTVRPSASAPAPAADVVDLDSPPARVGPPEENGLSRAFAKVDVVSTGDDTERLYTIEDFAVLPNGAVLPHRMKVAQLRVSSRQDGQWRGMLVDVDEAYRGKGYAFEMMRQAVLEVGPLRTSGVFSPAGKRQMLGLVRRGWATDLGDGDYLVHFIGTGRRARRP